MHKNDNGSLWQGHGTGGILDALVSLDVMFLSFNKFLTKKLTRLVVKVCCQDLLPRLVLKHPQTKPFQGALQRLGLIRFIDKPVPALGI